MGQELYDFAPVLRMLLLGAAIASLPLAWVWLRQRNLGTAQRLAYLTGLTLFLTFDLVLFGAFTRLTDSGLGCPDWPGCYGHASPIGASQWIAEAQSAMPTGPVTWSKAWVEMVHRYLATSVGGLILVLAVVSWMERKRLQIALHWPLMTLVWVCVQGAFGAWTVTLKLFPAIVTLHLLGAMVLLALLRVQAVRYQQATQHPHMLTGAWSVYTRRAVLAVFALVVVQIALGGWVSTNYAVLACNEFPTCQQSWWPDMDFRAGFELWRELGHNSAGEILHFGALTAIHYTHRLMAYAVLVALLALAWRLWRTDHRVPQACWLLGLAGWQLASGLSNVVLNWPMPAALAHTAGAAALVIVFTGWLADMYPARPSAS